MKIENHYSSIEAQPSGAMISSAVFRPQPALQVSPFFRAKWKTENDVRKKALPVILRNLGAEWACVPFGEPGIRAGLPKDWQPAAQVMDWDGFPHGYSSNHDWQLTKLDSNGIRAEIFYPPSTPIVRLVRDIKLDPDRAALHISLSINARRECDVPIGLHPVFDLSALEAESARLEIPPSAKAWTFPIDVEPGRSRFLADQRCANFAKLKTADSPVDIRRVPFDTATEDLVLLTDLSTDMAISFPTRDYRVRVDWDRRMLPNCLLWFSNGGRDDYPWNGVTRAIGIEPVAAAFDLGLGYSVAADTPLTKYGTPTSVSLSPERDWLIEYSIAVESLS